MRDRFRRSFNTDVSQWNVDSYPRLRSPGKLALSRLGRSRSALISGTAVALMLLLAVSAPVVRRMYGVDPGTQHQSLLDLYGLPLGYAGGLSGKHWLGVEPGLGRDIFIRVVYGLRTSIGIALTDATLTTLVGVLLGLLAGYLGGWVDTVIVWLIDFALAMPFLITALAVIPPLTLRFYGPRDAEPPLFRVATVILVLAVFGWTGTARLVRVQVMSLREREFVDAARAIGANLGHMLFRQLLPNIWAPVLVSFSLSIPAYVIGEAALSFIGIGVVDPTPDLGLMIQRSLPYAQADPAYVVFPGLLAFMLVLAFSLFGDAVRDALDPRSIR